MAKKLTLADMLRKFELLIMKSGKEVIENHQKPFK